MRKRQKVNLYGSKRLLPTSTGRINLTHTWRTCDADAINKKTFESFTPIHKVSVSRSCTDSNLAVPRFWWYSLPRHPDPYYFNIWPWSTTIYITLISGMADSLMLQSKFHKKTSIPSCFLALLLTLSINITPITLMATKFLYCLVNTK